MTLSYRFLSLADVSALSHIASEVFDDPIHREGAKTFLSDPNHFIVVAQDGKEKGLIVGFVSAVRQFHPDWERPELFISEVGVAPSYQRRGIAGTLMQMMLAKAKALHCGCAWVATEADNRAALGLYTSVGGKTSTNPIHIEFDLK